MLKEEEFFCLTIVRALLKKDKKEVLDLLAKLDPYQHSFLELQKYITEDEWKKIKWKHLKNILNHIDTNFVARNKNLYYEVTGKAIGAKKDGTASIKYTA